MDAGGERFVQNVRVQNISNAGALLSGIEHELRSGHMIGIQYDKKKARFRVVWVSEFGLAHKIQAAIQSTFNQRERAALTIASKPCCYRSSPPRCSPRQKQYPWVRAQSARERMGVARRQ